MPLLLTLPVRLIAAAGRQTVSAYAMLGDLFFGTLLLLP